MKGKYIGIGSPHWSQNPHTPTSPEEMRDLLDKGERVRGMCLKLLKVIYNQ